MIAKDLINYMIPPLKINDDIEKAKLWMEELRISELPVVDQGVFLGLLTEDTILEGEVQFPKVSDYDALANKGSVRFDTHYYDVLKTAYSLGVRVVAVSDEEGQYMGAISIEDVVEAFAHSSSVSIPGAILILTMDFRDYSLAEISRMVETEDAKILSSHLIMDPDSPSQVKLTIKINKEEVSHLSRIFESKGYKVSEFYHNIDQIEDPDQERFDALMRYLKI